MGVSSESRLQLREAVDQAPAVVRVQNLQTTARGPSDAWGRYGRRQPIQLSAEVALEQGFASTAAHDALVADTVHYGLLAKAMRTSVRGSRTRPDDRPDDNDASRSDAARAGLPEVSLFDILDLLWRDLSGDELANIGVGANAADRGWLKDTREERQQQRQEDEEEEGGEGELMTVDEEQEDGKPVLATAIAAGAVRSLSLTAHLPKASLVGDGVSLTLAGVFSRVDDDGGGPGTAGVLHMYGYTLKLHGLRAPTLIGLNDNERTARQTVIVNIEADNLATGSDTYPVLEARIVQELAMSSFGTLEALVARLAEVVSLYVRDMRLEPPDRSGTRLTISAEKPIAVPYADAPAVEIRVNTIEVLARASTRQPGHE